MATEEESTAPNPPTVTGSRHLEKRLGPDESVEATTIMDTRSILLGSVPTMLFSTFPIGIIFGGIAGFILINTGSTVLGVGAAAAIALAVGLSPLVFSYSIAKYGHIEYAVTDQRFVRVADIVVTTQENGVPIERARAVELNEGFLDTILGTGDIKIEDTGGDAVQFKNVPNNEEIYRLCQKKIQETDTVDGDSAR